MPDQTCVRLTKPQLCCPCSPRLANACQTLPGHDPPLLPWPATAFQTPACIDTASRCIAAPPRLTNANQNAAFLTLTLLPDQGPARHCKTNLDYTLLPSRCRPHASACDARRTGPLLPHQKRSSTRRNSQRRTQTCHDCVAKPSPRLIPVAFGPLLPDRSDSLGSWPGPHQP